MLNKVRCPYCGYENKFKPKRVKKVKGWIILAVHSKVCKSCGRPFKFIVKGDRIEFAHPKKASISID